MNKEDAVRSRRQTRKRGKVKASPFRAHMLIGSVLLSWAAAASYSACGGSLDWR